ncbi:MAG: Lactate utilization protein A [Alphaproteobacteria bacterium MarineAlpha10_Bin3]|nr:MAG: Lactate utilization protein A [Alphaproteobacteria bacterium MarineAlpha10_Bin3]PPR73938.1 MAG: Lactate utilization protein A [Alphaproteobacteria bacterium MarineAlpha4_Bin1]
MSKARPEVGLFVTCLVDLFRPGVGFAAVALLERAGCAVTVPRNQTCCGQPAYNGGDRANATAIAKQVVEAFEKFDYVVAPSGSCAGMIAKHYPQLFAGDPAMAARAGDLAGRTHELISFLVDIRGMDALDVKFDATATYHDACSGLRELGVKAQPRALLERIEGLRLVELPGAEMCCGVGGAFCVKYPDISNKMVANKTRDIAATGAELVLAGDLGCLMNIAGKLAREGSPVRVRHIAEVLAGMAGQPAIGEGRR